MNRPTLLLLLLLILAAEVVAANAPLFRVVPARDAGVFLYAGQQILAGKLLYRDIWDHKAPLIYYLNAGALGLAGGSWWGVWLLELVAIGLTVAGLWSLLRPAWGIWPAFLALVLGLISLTQVLEGGNFTEEYALPLQVAALYCFVRAEERGGVYGWRGLAIGVAGGLTFFLRQNLVGLWLAIGIYLLVARVGARRWRQLFGALAAMAGGAATIALVVVTFFVVQGAGNDFWDAAFRYNFTYVGVSLGSRLLALGFALLVLTALGVTALLGWIAGWYALRAAPDQVTPFRPLLGLALIDLPCEFLLFGLSGRTYPHYAMTWLPALIVLAGFFLYALPNGLWCKVGRVKIVWPLGLLAVLLILNFWLLQGPVQKLAKIDAYDAGDNAREAATYIRHATAVDDEVLLWGNEGGLNFVTGRRCPTRFVNQLPLFLRLYQNADHAATFLNDLQTSPPVLIIDTSPTTPVIPPLDAAARAAWVSPDPTYGLPPAMTPVLDYIAANYQQVTTVGPQRWPVYRWIGTTP